MLKYKGYYCVPQYSDEDGIYWGKIEEISDSVIFESEQESGIESEFQNAVNDYIEFKNDCFRSVQPLAK